jgi:hypothetical protein
MPRFSTHCAPNGTLGNTMMAANRPSRDRGSRPQGVVCGPTRVLWTSFPACRPSAIVRPSGVARTMADTVRMGMQRSVSGRHTRF